MARFGPGLVDEMQSLLNADLAEQAASLAAQNTALAAEVRCDTAEWRYQHALSRLPMTILSLLFVLL